MRYIKGYGLYKQYKKVNEEFVGKLVNGSLSNLLQVFSSPFKDIPEDIKRSFKDDDPNSIKNILVSSFNKAIDGSLKEIRNLKSPIPGKDGEDDSKNDDIESIIDGFITSLTDLANGIGKDFTSSITDKNQASGANELAKAILLGNKEADWEGIITYMNDPKYKYSKPKYESILITAAGQKTGVELFKAKQNASYGFFSEFQKDITSQLSKNFTEEEMKKVYDDAVKKGGGIVNAYDYNSLLNLKNKKVLVKYKLKGYDESKSAESQTFEIGQKEISELDEEKSTVTFIGNDGSKIVKKYSDILGPVDQKEEQKTGADVNREVTDNLKELSKNPKNIELIKNITDTMKSDPTILSKIQEILPK